MLKSGCLVALLVAGISLGGPASAASPSQAPSPSMDQPDLSVSPAVRQQQGCSATVEEIRRLWSAKDPGLLSLDILNSGCSQPQLYQAAYYQGFGFYFLGRLQDALLNLELARSLSGPWDEQILYFIWKIHVALDNAEGQERLLREMRGAFPKSARLPEMIEAYRRALKTGYSGWFLAGPVYSIGKKSYQGLKSITLVNGTLNQEKGNHRFAEYLNASGHFSLDGRKQHFYGFEAGFEYLFGGFRIQAESGPLYSEYPVDTSAGEGSSVQGPVLKKWEWQRMLQLSQALELSAAWILTGSLNHYQSGSSFASFGLESGLERTVSDSHLSLEALAERQDFELQGKCVDLGAFAQCESTRILAAETNGEYGRGSGRHSLDALWRGRLEAAASDSSESRLIGIVGAQYGFRIMAVSKLTNRIEWGAQWEGNRREPILRYSLNLLTVF